MSGVTNVRTPLRLIFVIDAIAMLRFANKNVRYDECLLVYTRARDIAAVLDNNT